MEAMSTRSAESEKESASLREESRGHARQEGVLGGADGGLTRKGPPAFDEKPIHGHLPAKV